MEEEEGFNEELRALKLNDEKLSSWRTKPPSPPHQQCALGGASSSTSAANAAVTSAGEATLTSSSVEQRLLQLEQREVANSRRIEALEASAHVQRKVVCELLLQDLAHDDRAVAAITRVKQLLQRTFPERCDSGIVWLGNGGCQLACLAPETLIHVMEFLKSKFGRTAVSKVAPVFWMPQPNLRRAKSVSSFVHGHGQAVVTLSGHKGLYAKFMGMYELDLRHLVHGWPLFKKMGMPNNPHFIYKCSLNGKWLVTDEAEHCPKNLSRLGTKYSAESPDDPGMVFEVWQDGAWAADPSLSVAEGRVKDFPNFVTFHGHTGQQTRFMGTYELDPSRVVHGYPLYCRKIQPNKRGDTDNSAAAAAPLRSSHHGESAIAAAAVAGPSSPTFLAQNKGPEATVVSRSGGGGDSSRGAGGGGQGGQGSSNSGVGGRVGGCGGGGGGGGGGERRREKPPSTSAAERKDFVYKCSLNGKWLLTDDSDHFAMNLSRIGTEASCEHFFSDAGDSDENENGNGGGTGLLKTVATPDAASSCPPVSSKALVPKQKIHFEVWRNGAWHKDPLLKATRGHSGSGGGVGPDKDIYVR